jgi:hypothetical protein
MLNPDYPSSLQQVQSLANYRTAYTKLLHEDPLRGKAITRPIVAGQDHVQKHVRYLVL